MVGEVTNIQQHWQKDYVSFLLGCSFTFENALIAQGIPLRHVTEKKNVAMYETNIPCKTAGRFYGNMVLSMRPIRADQIPKAVRVTARYPTMHGAPIQVGAPERLSIKNIDAPDYGDPIEIANDEIPVFWACGVTPQLVAQQAKPEMMITHSPGHMFITDRWDSEMVDVS